MTSRPLTFRTMWITVLLGILIGTAPNWLNSTARSTYDAPWIHPGLVER